MVTNTPSFEQEASFEAVSMVAPREITAQQEVRPTTGIESTIIVAALGSAAIFASLFNRNKHN